MNGAKVAPAPVTPGLPPGLRMGSRSNNPPVTQGNAGVERGEPLRRTGIPSTPPRTVDVRPQVRTPLRSPEQMDEQLIGASYSLPQFGGADVRACAGMVDTVGSNGDEADLRRTVTFPDLEIPTGQTWERNVAFSSLGS